MLTSGFDAARAALFSGQILPVRQKVLSAERRPSGQIWPRAMQEVTGASQKPRADARLAKRAEGGKSFTLQ
jgi:hypothetical protein